MAKSAAGAKGKDLAEEYNLSRDTISEILNSPDAKARAELIQKEVTSMVPAALKTLFDSIKVGDYLASRDVLRSTGALQDLKKIEVTGQGGGPVKIEAAVSGELKISLEERIKLIKGE